MKDKKTLITIIVLLVIMIPISGYATYKHFYIPKNTLKENPNKEMFFDNKVYLYLDGQFLGYYDCTTCSKVDYIINDNSYHTNYYSNGTEDMNGAINSMYAIFKENNQAVVYNIVGKSIIGKYDEVKNYKVKSSGKYLIYKSNRKYGIINFDIGGTPIPCDYDYISIPAHLNDSILDSSKFIALTNSTWKIIDNKNNVLATSNEEIVDFNDSYYITYSGGYNIYDYEGNKYLESIPKTNVYGVGDYLFVLNDKQLFIYKNLNENMITYKLLNDYKNIYFNKTEKGIEIIIDGNVTETLELS